MASRHDRDWGFLYWTAVGFLMSFGVIAILSIGFPFFALGLVLLVVGLWRGPRWPADLGLLSGIGASCLLIALIQVFVGSLDPTVWTAVGATLVALGAGPFWWLRCRRPRATSA
jgi:hypothetical protein